MSKRSRRRHDTPDQVKTAAGRPDGKPIWSLAISAVAIAVIVAIAFSPVLRADFIDWDDDIHVYQNPHLIGANGPDAGYFWSNPYRDMFMPVTYSLWAGLVRVAKAPAGAATAFDPHPFHAVNYILHIINALLVFALLFTALRKSLPAAAGALLFALHPMQVESVAWVSELKGVLCGTFALGSVWLYLLYARNSTDTRWTYYGIGTACLVLAMLSKPIAVVIPAMAWGVEWGLLGHGKQWRSWPLGVWLGMSALWSLVVRMVQPAPAIFVRDVAFWQRPFVAGDALAFYLAKLVWPWPLLVHYGRTPAWVLAHPWAYIDWIVPAAVLAGLWFLRRRMPALTAAGAVFTIVLLPVLGLTAFDFQMYSTVADRYLYMALLGPAMALAWALSQSKSMAPIAVAGVLLAILAGVSWKQCGYWRNAETVFRHTLAYNPDSWMAHNNLGVFMVANGRPAEAIPQDRMAAAIQERRGVSTSLASVYVKLGDALMKTNQPAEALVACRRAIQLEPSNAAAHVTLGSAIEAQGDLAGATDEYREALNLDPKRDDARARLAYALQARGDTAGAAELWSEAKAMGLETAASHYAQGAALDAKGDTEGAMREFEAAVQLAPKWADAENSLGVMLAKLNRPAEAATHFARAVQLDPTNTNEQQNLARARAAAGLGAKPPR
ncbi:MAG: tetratricopeptide repeat protein [Capsulimonadaceae bacterium]